MKSEMIEPRRRLALVLAVASGALTCNADSQSLGLPRPAPGVPSAEAATNLVNYVVRVEWKNKKDAVQVLQVTAAEGSFHLTTSQPSEVKANNSELPISINLEGELKVINAKQGRLQLFLGRTVPYVTSGTGSSAASSIQQRQEGLTSAFAVTFGKPLIIQKDANGEVSVLVQREEP